MHRLSNEHPPNGGCSSQDERRQSNHGSEAGRSVAIASTRAPKALRRDVCARRVLFRKIRARGIRVRGMRLWADDHHIGKPAVPARFAICAQRGQAETAAICTRRVDERTTPGSTNAGVDEIACRQIRAQTCRADCRQHVQTRRIASVVAAPGIERTGHHGQSHRLQRTRVLADITTRAPPDAARHGNKQYHERPRHPAFHRIAAHRTGAPVRQRPATPPSPESCRSWPATRAGRSCARTRRWNPPPRSPACPAPRIRRSPPCRGRRSPPPWRP